METVAGEPTDMTEHDHFNPYSLTDRPRRETTYGESTSKEVEDVKRSIREYSVDAKRSLVDAIPTENTREVTHQT